jgi:TolB-like protein
VTDVPAKVADVVSKAVPEKSVAVLPFANMSADEGNQHFCDGLAEELLNAPTTRCFSPFTDASTRR